MKSHQFRLISESRYQLFLRKCFINFQVCVLDRDRLRKHQPILIIKKPIFLHFIKMQELFIRSISITWKSCLETLEFSHLQKSCSYFKSVCRKRSVKQPSLWEFQEALRIMSHICFWKYTTKINVPVGLETLKILFPSYLIWIFLKGCNNAQERCSSSDFHISWLNIINNRDRYFSCQFFKSFKISPQRQIVHRDFFFFISWRLITLQYCSGFCHTLT